ncbi:hypothetical protein GCM10020216_030400 [Nonomuraea helvata]
MTGSGGLGLPLRPFGVTHEAEQFLGMLGLDPDAARKRAFGALDAHLWRLVYKWAKISHPNKPKRWIIARYFGMFNTARRDKWVFGSQETGFYLRKFAWTKVVRHRMVAGRTSPDDPTLIDYRAAPPCQGPSGRRNVAASSPTGRPDVRSAGAYCCTLTMSHRARSSGSSGSRPRAQRSANRRSLPPWSSETRTNTPQHVSYMPTAGADSATTPTRHFRTASNLQGLLEPVAWKAGTAGSEGAGAR